MVVPVAYAFCQSATLYWQWVAALCTHKANDISWGLLICLEGCLASDPLAASIPSDCVVKLLGAMHAACEYQTRLA